MATQLQLRKGTKIQNDAFTGAEAELTYDTTSKGLRIHDGETQGGICVGTVSHCSFNTNTRIQITTTNQTVTKNGWLVGFMAYSGSTGTGKILINDIEISRGSTTSSSMWGNVSVAIPLKVGQTYRYDLDATVQYNSVYFYPDD